MILLNLNDQVKVRLSEKAKAHLKKSNIIFWTEANISDSYRKEMIDSYTQPEVDADGYSEFTLHELMHKFGPVLVTGFGDNYFIDNEILIT